jgi:hypothetical protein
MKEFRIRSFAWFDTIIILFLATVVLAAFPFLSSIKPGKVVVYKDNSVIAEYPVTEGRVFEIAGADGPVKIRIDNGSVQVVSSSCAHQVCVNHGRISRPNSQIICVPNHILITIKPAVTSQQDFDAIAR